MVSPRTQARLNANEKLVRNLDVFSNRPRFPYPRAPSPRRTYRKSKHHRSQRYNKSLLKYPSNMIKSMLKKTQHKGGKSRRHTRRSTRRHTRRQ